MVDLNSEYSDLIEDIPIDSTGPFHHQTFEGELTKVDNIAGGGGEVVRTIPKLVRSIP